MKRILVFAVVCLFSLGLIAPSGVALNAQEAGKSDAKAMAVLKKMIEAMGGRSTMEAVKDMTATGTMEMPSMGMEGSATLYTKKENLFRMDIEIMGMSITQAFDGEIGWYTNPQTGAVEELEGEQLEDMKRQAIGDAAYFAPEKYGIVYTSKGQEKLEDKDYDVLQMTYADGFEVTLYIDGKTHLPYKTVSIAPNPMTGVEGEVEAFSSDYREINGMMVAHTITQYTDGEEFMIITMDEIKFDTGLDESLFKKE
jgi:outer membrane lipoprotein-sorting protein